MEIWFPVEFEENLFPEVKNYLPGRINSDYFVKKIPNDELFLSINGNQELKYRKLKAVMKKLGANGFYEHVDGDGVIEYKQFDFILSGIESKKISRGNKSIAFTTNAIYKALHDGEEQGHWATIINTVPTSVAEKYGYSYPEKGDKGKISSRGILVSSMLEDLADNAFRMAGEIGADAIYVEKIEAKRFQTSFVLEFYRK